MSFFCSLSCFDLSLICLFSSFFCQCGSCVKVYSCIVPLSRKRKLCDRHSSFFTRGDALNDGLFFLLSCSEALVGIAHVVLDGSFGMLSVIFHKVGAFFKECSSFLSSPRVFFYGAFLHHTEHTI